MAYIKPLQEKAYDYLRDKISRGELLANVIYSETKLAAEIGISRTPMKDALVRLSQDKYIDIIPSKGFCLHVMSDEDIWNTYQARTAVEGFCALTLHQNRNTSEGIATIQAMQSSLDAFSHAIDHGEKLSEIFKHDLRFHCVLVEFSKNPELIRLFESYHHRLSDIAMKTFEQPGRALIALEEHKAILRQITSDNSNAGTHTYKAVMNHMEAARNIALRQCP